MLAGCELLQRGGNGTGVTAVSRAILYTDSPVENNNTNVGFFFCLFTRRKVHLSFTCFDKLRGGTRYLVQHAHSHTGAELDQSPLGPD